MTPRTFSALRRRAAQLPGESPTYAASRAFQIIGGMLRRGFTTIRDCGGADYGLAKAVAEGRVAGPRRVAENEEADMQVGVPKESRRAHSVCA
jgi:imidazolonepropionase-like amidohydrolase